MAQPRKARRRVDKHSRGRTPDEPAALAMGVMRPHDHKLTTATGRLPAHTARKTASSKLGISPTAASD
eukprot:12884057-Prorocentrum_lima.AAC.1